MIRNYYEQLKANKVDNLEMYNLSRLKQEENMKRPITSKEFESVIKQQQKKLPTNRSWGPGASLLV